MLAKIKAAYGVMQAGKSVADPALWKGRQITASAITTILWAVVRFAEAFGFPVPIDGEVIDALAVVILWAVNFVLTLATTKKAVL